MTKISTINTGWRYPLSVVEVTPDNRERGLHGTQKPIKLMELLVESFVPMGGVVVDPFMGSGTTLVAARNLGRGFIGGDINPFFVGMVRRRLDAPYQQRLVMV